MSRGGVDGVVSPSGGNPAVGEVVVQRRRELDDHIGVLKGGLWFAVIVEINGWFLLLLLGFIGHVHLSLCFR